MCVGPNPRYSGRVLCIALPHNVKMPSLSLFGSMICMCVYELLAQIYRFKGNIFVGCCVRSELACVHLHNVIITNIKGLY